jgi:CHAT domain-containing protein
LYRALNGDFEGADDALAIAKSRVPEMYNWSSGLHWVPMLESLVNLAAGHTNLLKGDYPEAEKILRRAIQVYDKEIVSGGSNDLLSLSGRTVQQTRYLGRTYCSRILSLAVLRQGRHVEAEVIARDTVLKQARVFGRYSGQTLEGLRALSEIVTEQGRFEDAEKLVRASIDIYDRIGVKPNSVTLGITRRTLADIYVGQARWQEAQKVYDALARDLAGRLVGLAQIFDANLNWAIPLVRLNRGAEAVRRLEKFHATFVKRVGENHYAAAEARGMLASALAATGQTRQALDAFTKAVPALLSRDNLSEGEGASTSGRLMRLRFILDSYIGVLRNIAASGGKLPDGKDAVKEAFRIANAARGGTVKEALASSAARAASGDPELADLARREQNTMQKIGALNGVLRTAGGGDAKAREALIIRIRTLQAARSALMEEITRRFPNYADLIDPKPATIAEVRKTLRSGEALLSTYSTAERTYVWAVPYRGEVAFAAVDMGRDELAETVEWLRVALEPNATTLGDIPDLDLGVAHALYKKLLEPVKSGWWDAKSLLVVAHGALGYLPLSLLPTGPAKLGPEKGALFANYRDVPWLVRTHTVTMLPSVASLKTLRGLPPGDAKRKAFVGFGDPYFSRAQAEAAARKTAKPVQVASLAGRGLQSRGLPVRLRAAPATQALDSAELARLPRLPDTADEIRSIAVALKADLTQDVFLGERANEGAVKTLDLSGYKVLAFATHGLVPGDLNGLVQPALALSAPEVAGGKDDGLLTMGEILGLRLNADWVVLSACNTGSGQGAGAEAVSGLGRAFFYAGTRALLVSNWPVETTSATALTTDLFRRQAGDASLGRAEARRQAMLAMIDGPGYVDPKSGKTVFSYAHPIFWAPFTLIGDGGGARPGA